MESRHGNLRGAGAKFKSSELPHDYIKMVGGVFANHFDEGLQALAQLGYTPSFVVGGAVFPNEVLLNVALTVEGQLKATTVHASADFDPKASSPTAQELLSACVDALGGVFNVLIEPGDPAKLKTLVEDSLTELEGVPLEWDQMEVDRFRIFLKVDKANPQLENLADDWLRKNDPLAHKILDEESAETEKLFFKGPKPPKDLAELTGEEPEDDDSGDDGGGSPIVH